MAKSSPSSKSSTDDQDKSPSSIQSVEIGSRVLFTLANRGKASTLTEIARSLSQHPSSVRRYLVSLVNSGLVIQNSQTQEYDLGPACIRLGALAMGRIPLLELARREAKLLRDATNLSAMVLVWGTNGPVIIDLKESPLAISVVGRIGSTLSPVYSISGRVFLAHKDKQEATRFYELAAEESQLQALKSPASQLSLDDFLAQLTDIKERRLGRVQGDYTPGVSALAAPVLGADNDVQVVLTLLGQSGVIDTSWQGDPAKALKKAAKRLSIAYGNLENTEDLAQIKDLLDLGAFIGE